MTVTISETWDGWRVQHPNRAKGMTTITFAGALWQAWRMHRRSK